MRPHWIALLVLSACGSGDGEGGEGADTAQIERLSTPEVVTEDPRESVRLAPLSARDLEAEGLAGPSCRFQVGDMVLLAASGSDALVAAPGGLRHLVQSAPVLANGGFFEDRMLSISIGRTDAPESGNERAAFPARMAVTNRRTGAQQKIQGYWACTG